MLRDEVVDDSDDTLIADGTQHEEIEVTDDDDDTSVHDDVDYSDVTDEWQHRVALGLDDDDEIIVLVLRFGVVDKKCDDDCEYLVI